MIPSIHEGDETLKKCKCLELARFRANANRLRPTKKFAFDKESGQLVGDSISGGNYFGGYPSLSAYRRASADVQLPTDCLATTLMDANGRQ